MQNEALDIFKDQVTECEKVCNSFQYFVDTYVWIEDKITNQAIPFKLWPCQVRILPKILTALLLIILKARQLGLTWLVAAYCLWLAMTKPLQLIVIISYKEQIAWEVTARIKFMLTKLPEWLYPPLVKATSEEVIFEHTGGLQSIIQSIATTPSGAQSKTINLLVLDETCLNRYVQQIYAASKPGVDSARGRIIIISNSIKTAPGWAWTRDIFTNSMKGLNTFKRVFMPWSDHPLRSKKLVYDEELKENICQFIKEQRDGGMDDEEISEHYPASEDEAISAVLGSYFGRVLAKHTLTIKGNTGYLHKDKFNDIEFVPEKRGVLEIWRYPYHMVDSWDGTFWENRYAIGSDISEGLGQTYSVAYVLDRKLGEFVARMRSNRIDAAEWAKLLFDLSKYYRNADGPALICPERTGAGITTCKELMNFEALVYFRMVAAKVGGPTKELGWPETQQNKHELCGDFKKWLRNTQGTVYDAILIEECSTFIRDDVGRLHAEEGKLDDCVIGAGCTIQASHFIGEPPRQVPEGPTGWLEKWQKDQL